MPSAPFELLRRLGLWPLRALWLVLPLAAGDSIAAAVAERSGSVRVIVAIGAWGIWALTLVALLVPRTTSLTAVRIVSPAAVLAAAWAAVLADEAIAGAAGVGVAAASTLVLFLPATGETFVNGSSYGDERRMLLRTPLVLLLAPVPLVWAATVAGAVAGPLLLAAGQWVLGGAAVAVGVPAVVLGGRALHGLSRRWVVFVPAGLVLHDAMALADPVLFPRRRIRRLGPALAGTASLDLTLGAPGLALELELGEPVEVTLGRLAPEPGARRALDGYLFAPSRPAATVREAERRRFPVG